MEWKNPIEHGLPPKFKTFREVQKIGAESIITCKKRFLFQSLPTGSGKSLEYMAAAVITGRRTLILTASKALQDQLIQDFASIGLVDARGMNNYDCNAYPGIRASDGPCTAGNFCTLKPFGCSYYTAIERAKQHKLVVTNYQFWLSLNKAANGEPVLGQFDQLVMDEVHLAPQILLDFFTVELKRSDVKETVNREIPEYKTKQQVELFCKELAQSLTEVIQRLTAKINRHIAKVADYGKLAKANRLLNDCIKVFNTVLQDNYSFVIDNDGLKCGINRPYPYIGESCLFANCRKIVGVSATMRPMTAELLGIKKEDYDFEEYPSQFDSNRHPTIHVKTIRINASTPKEVIAAHIVPKIDAIIDRRRDRKGIIQVTSYEYSELIEANTRHKDIIFFPKRNSTKESIESFRRAKAPAVICSPALVQGYDFSGEECEYQIHVKLPFPSLAPNSLFKIRSDIDGRLIPYYTIQSFVQRCGRGMRHEKDLCENIILDDQIEWFMKSFMHLFPYWFVKSFRSQQVIPEPLPKL